MIFKKLLSFPKHCQNCTFYFLARVAVAQSSSLNLFANRDVELEQRAMLLKRLAFAIFSSEVDQYQKYLPDIQGNSNQACNFMNKSHGVLLAILHK